MWQRGNDIAVSSLQSCPGVGACHDSRPHPGGTHCLFARPRPGHGVVAIDPASNAVTNIITHALPLADKNIDPSSRPTATTSSCTDALDSTPRFPEHSSLRERGPERGSGSWSGSGSGSEILMEGERRSEGPSAQPLPPGLSFPFPANSSRSPREDAASPAPAHPAPAPAPALRDRPRAPALTLRIDLAEPLGTSNSCTGIAPGTTTVPGGGSGASGGRRGEAGSQALVCR
jgi:hypothetical protein